MIRFAVPVLFALSVSPAFAGQTAPLMPRHDGAMDHAVHMAQSEQTAAPAPLEPGQGAFAAIQEIVALLEADSETDWSSVDIEALRRHLIDMNEVTLNAQVSVDPVPHGTRFTVRGEGRTGDAIRRMVTAHAATMAGRGPWRFEAIETPAGAALSVVGDTDADGEKIRALGFIGVMAQGMHHQQHHLAIASGNAPHH